MGTNPIVIPPKSMMQIIATHFRYGSSCPNVSLYVTIFYKFFCAATAMQVQFSQLTYDKGVKNTTKEKMD